MFLLSPSFSRQRFLSASLSALRWLSRLLCCSRAFSRSSCLRLDSKLFLLPTLKGGGGKKKLLSPGYPNSVQKVLHVNVLGALYKCKRIHFEVTIRILHHQCHQCHDQCQSLGNITIGESDRIYNTRSIKPGQRPSKNWKVGQAKIKAAKLADPALWGQYFGY